LPANRWACGGSPALQKHLPSPENPAAKSRYRDCCGRAADRCWLLAFSETTGSFSLEAGSRVPSRNCRHSCPMAVRPAESLGNSDRSIGCSASSGLAAACCWGAAGVRCCVRRCGCRVVARGMLPAAACSSSAGWRLRSAPRRGVADDGLASDRPAAADASGSGRTPWLRDGCGGCCLAVLGGCGRVKA
jgi:hypothetical protein